jgi:hypothetical protein
MLLQKSQLSPKKAVLVRNGENQTDKNSSGSQRSKIFCEMIFCFVWLKDQIKTCKGEILTYHALQ